MSALDFIPGSTAIMEPELLARVANSSLRASIARVDDV